MTARFGVSTRLLARLVVLAVLVALVASASERHTAGPAPDVRLLAVSAPTYVQSAGSTADGHATTIAKAFTSPTAAGNLIAAAASWDANSNSGTLTCTDTQANSYTTAVTQWDSVNNQWLGVCYAPNVKAGADTVTA